MAQNQTLLESFKLPLTRSCLIPLNLGLVSFFLHLFDEDAIFGWAWGKLSLFHLVWIFYHLRFVTENPRGFFLFFSGITTWQHVQCASFMLFLHNAAFVSLAMFILHGCIITDNASDGWMVDGHVHQHPSCETSVLFVYVLNDFDITNTKKKLCQNVDDNFLNGWWGITNLLFSCM